MDRKKIVIKEIDTSSAEENFARQIDNTSSEIYFLNGKWGSGKTVFLKKVEKRSKKKFIFLNLWEETGNDSVFKSAFKEICGFWYYAFNCTSIICVAISILLTPTINLGLTKYVTTSFFIIFGMSALIVSVVKFLKVDYDTFYKWFLNIISTKYFLKFNSKKILIIDDFDRMDYEKQKECFHLINFLKGKVTIICCGHFENIVNLESLKISTEHYLEKLIDRRFELPSNLQAKEMIDSIEKEIAEKLGPINNRTLIDNIYKIMIDENRSLREIEHFVDKVNYEFFELHKENKVQVEQLLVVIYLYLFYPKEYLNLRNNGLSNVDNGDVTISQENTNNKNIERLYKLLENNKERYPLNFSDKANLYYVDEYVPTLSDVELSEIIIF